MLARRRKDGQLASHIMRKQERSKTVQFARNAIRQNDLIYNQPCKIFNLDQKQHKHSSGTTVEKRGRLLASPQRINCVNRITYE